MEWCFPNDLIAVRIIRKIELITVNAENIK